MLTLADLDLLGLGPKDVDGLNAPLRETLRVAPSACGAQNDFMPFKVERVQFRGGSSAIPTVTITVTHGIREFTDAATGETMEDAMSNCVARVMRVNQCNLASVSFGAAARGIAVSIEIDSRTFSGIGMHSDLWVACVTGLVQACNSAIEAGALVPA